MQKIFISQKTFFSALITASAFFFAPSLVFAAAQPAQQADEGKLDGIKSDPKQLQENFRQEYAAAMKDANTLEEKQDVRAKMQPKRAACQAGGCDCSKIW